MTDKREYTLSFQVNSVYSAESNWRDKTITASNDYDAVQLAKVALWKREISSASKYVSDAYLTNPEGKELFIPGHSDNKRASIDTIIFDIGGVLARGGHRGIIWQWLADNKAVSPEVIKEFRFGKFREQEWNAWSDYKVGKCSHKDYWRRTLAGTGLEPKAKEIAQLVWDGFSKCEAESGMRFLPLLKPQGYNLAVLSNHVKEWGWSVVDQLKLRDYCNPIIISADIGMKKPDAEIYDYTLKAVNRAGSPHKCLFIDDKLENILAAMNAGMHAFHFNDREGFAADQLLELELRGYGVLK